MRLATICRIRDEQDILPLFLAHSKALFDLILVVEHRSVDLSRQMLELFQKSDGFFLYSLGTFSNHSTAVTQLLIKEAFAKGADFVFLPDADEFFDVQSRKDLESLIQDHENEILEFKWKNTIISGLTEERNNPNPESILHVPTKPARLGKVVLSRKMFLDNPNYIPCTGNHWILDENENTIPARMVGEILHIPFRSRNQFAAKILRSSLDKLSQRGMPTVAGWHYFRPLEAFAQSGISDEELLYITAYYAEGWCGHTLSTEELFGPAFQKRSFKSIALDLNVYELINSCLAQNNKLPLERLLAHYVIQFKTEIPNCSRLEIQGEHILPSKASSVPLTEEGFTEWMFSENARLLKENRALIQHNVHVQKGVSELQQYISRLEGERSILQEMVDGSEEKHREIKKNFGEEYKRTINELRAEIDERGAVLDKKRAEVAELRALVDKLKNQSLPFTLH